MEHITALLKIAAAATWFISPPPFPSLSPFFLFRKSLRCSSFSAPPRGGKWVTARRLVSSFISWRNRERLSESEGCGGTVGASRPSPSAARLSRSLLYGHGGATGQRVKMNQWPVFIRGLEKQRTSPWASGRRAWNSVGDGGGKRQTVNIRISIPPDRYSDIHQEKMITWDWRRPSQAAFTPKSSTAAKKVEFIYFQQGSQGVEASFFFAVRIDVTASRVARPWTVPPPLLQSWPRYAHLVPQVRHINTLLSRHRRTSFQAALLLCNFFVSDLLSLVSSSSKLLDCCVTLTGLSTVQFGNSCRTDSQKKQQPKNMQNRPFFLPNYKHLKAA